MTTEEYLKELGGTPTEKWTYKTLVDYIRKINREVNSRLYDYKKAVKNEQVTANAFVDKEIEKLTATGGKGRGYKSVGLRLRGKTKSELLNQATELYKFVEQDIYTPKGEDMATEQRLKEYESFIKNANGDYSDLSYNEWEQLVVSFGNLDESILNQFGSTNVVGLLKEKNWDLKEIDLVSMLQEVMADNKGKTQKELITKLRSKLGL